MPALASNLKSNFAVKTEKFEGSLDLLLTLIERRKLHIGDIALSRVADDYINYIEGLREFPLEDAAHFVFVTSTLLLIKSKALLPNLDLTVEESADVEQLEKRLKIYALLREKAELLSALYGKAPMYFKNFSEKSLPQGMFLPGKMLSLEQVYSSISVVLNNLPKKEFLPEAKVKKIINIEEVINNLLQRIRVKLSATFSELTGNGSNKTETIVSFLALLELVKKGLVVVKQRRAFGDIILEGEEITVPEYR